MQITKTPVIIYAESTPNPAAMKFVANRLLVENNATVEYTDAPQAKASPLATKLFSFPFVKGIFMTANFITLTKNDSINWEDVIHELREFIQNYLSDENPVFSSTPQQTQSKEQTEIAHNIPTMHSEPSSDVEFRIIEILEEYIRPAVEQDGGAIYFQSLKDGVVTVALKGACSGCPSSTITLKAGIEGLLKRMIPEVREVVAEAL